jgi:hypothetical protein
MIPEPACVWRGKPQLKRRVYHCCQILNSTDVEQRSRKLAAFRTHRSTSTGTVPANTARNTRGQHGTVGQYCSEAEAQIQRITTSRMDCTLMLIIHGISYVMEIYWPIPRGVINSCINKYVIMRCTSVNHYLMRILDATIISYCETVIIC